MKYIVELYVTHADKEYWEIEVPEGTDINDLAIKISDDPYMVILDFEGDMVDSDHVETLNMSYNYMYKAEEDNPSSNSDLEDDVSP